MFYQGAYQLVVHPESVMLRFYFQYCPAVLLPLTHGSNCTGLCQIENREWGNTVVVFFVFFFLGVGVCMCVCVRVVFLLCSFQPRCLPRHDEYNTEQYLQEGRERLFFFLSLFPFFFLIFGFGYLALRRPRDLNRSKLNMSAHPAAPQRRLRLCDSLHEWAAWPVNVLLLVTCQKHLSAVRNPPTPPPRPPLDIWAQRTLWVSLCCILKCSCLLYSEKELSFQHLNIHTCTYGK